MRRMETQGVVEEGDGGLAIVRLGVVLRSLRVAVVVERVALDRGADVLEARRRVDGGVILGDGGGVRGHQHERSDDKGDDVRDAEDGSERARGGLAERDVRDGRGDRGDGRGKAEELDAEVDVGLDRHHGERAEGAGAERSIAPAAKGDDPEPRERETDERGAGDAPVDDGLQIGVLGVRERREAGVGIDARERGLEAAAANAEPRRFLDEGGARLPGGELGARARDLVERELAELVADVTGARIDDDEHGAHGDDADRQRLREQIAAAARAAVRIGDALRDQRAADDEHAEDQRERGAARDGGDGERATQGHDGDPCNAEPVGLARVRGEADREYGAGGHQAAEVVEVEERTDEVRVRVGRLVEAVDAGRTEELVDPHDAGGHAA